jgi:hypothetical protein
MTLLLMLMLISIVIPIEPLTTLLIPWCCILYYRSSKVRCNGYDVWLRPDLYRPSLSLPQQPRNHGHYLLPSLR